MTVDTPVVAVASAIIFVCLVLLLMSRARALHSRSRRVDLVLNPSIGALAVGLVWLLYGEPPAVCLLQAVLAAACVTIIGGVTSRAVPGLGGFFFTFGWSVVVLAPVGIALFDLRRGVLAHSFGTLDFGGAAVLGVCTGLVAIVFAAITRYGQKTVAEIAPGTGSPLLLSAVAAVLCCAALGIGSELVLDGTTRRILLSVVIAAPGGAIGWMSAEVLVARRATPTGAVRGLVSGLVATLAALPWLHPVAAFTIAVVTGLVGAVTANSWLKRGAREHAALIGTLLVPGAMGLLATGVVAQRVGLLYSGYTDQVIAQTVGLAIVVGYASVATLVLALIALQLTEKQRHYRARLSD